MKPDIDRQLIGRANKARGAEVERLVAAFYPGGWRNIDRGGAWGDVQTPTLVIEVKSRRQAMPALFDGALEQMRRAEEQTGLDGRVVVAYTPGRGVKRRFLEIKEVFAEDSTVALSEQLVEALSQSATLSGNSRPPSYWRRAWKRRTYLRRLSGLTSEPSTLALGVEQWTASLRASRASPTASPVSNAESMTSATSGMSAFESLLRVVRAGAFSRTWAARGRSTNSDSVPTLRLPGFAPEPLSFELLTWEPRTSVAVYSSSRWSTPTGTDAKGRDCYRRRDQADMALGGQAKQWATPTGRDWKDGADPSAAVPTNALLGRQAPRITRAGLLSLLPDDWTSSPLRLNHRFVEWLMDFPENWVSAERTS